MNRIIFKKIIQSKLILAFLIISFSFQVFSVSAQETFKVVLDAGHGGTDPGNLGSGYYEKDIVLKISLAVGKLLDNDENIEVIYTRKDDTFIELHERNNTEKYKKDSFMSFIVSALIVYNTFYIVF